MIYLKDTNANIRKNNVKLGQILWTTRLEVHIQYTLIKYNSRAHRHKKADCQGKYQKIQYRFSQDFNLRSFIVPSRAIRDVVIIV